jgi:hypothetical protein
MGMRAYFLELDSDNMTEVLDNKLSKEENAELTAYFSELRAFFKAAADRGHGILLGIM